MKCFMLAMNKNTKYNLYSQLYFLKVEIISLKVYYKFIFWTFCVLYIMEKYLLCKKKQSI